MLQPISRILTHRHGANTIAYLRSLIPLVRTLTPLGYGAGNMLDLAIVVRVASRREDRPKVNELQADFTAWDLTDLHICEVDFQEVPLPQVNFSGTTFDRCKFAQGMGIIFDLAFSPDGELIAASGTDCQIHLYSVATGRKHLLLSGHTGWVGTICFSSDSRYLVSGSKIVPFGSGIRAQGNVCKYFMGIRIISGSLIFYRAIRSSSALICLALSNFGGSNVPNRCFRCGILVTRWCGRSVSIPLGLEW